MREGGRRDEVRGPHFVPTLSFICGSDGGGVGICWLRPSTFAAGVHLTYMSFCGFILPFVCLFFCTNNNLGH